MPAARRSARVVAYLKTQQVDKLQTTGINLNPNYIYTNGSNPKISGYTATNSISFQVPTERAGTILDAAVKNGATRIDGVNFVAGDRAIAAIENQDCRFALIALRQTKLLARHILERKRQRLFF